MSARRLLLDGPDLRALVEEAAELGGRVVRAERLRRGLLGRRWYEVTVDVPALSAAGSRAGAPAVGAAGAPPPPPPAVGIDALVGTAEAVERADAAAVRAAQGTRARPPTEEGGR